MPKSRTRKKAQYTAPQQKAAPKVGNPVWFVPVVIGLLVLALAWIVVTYLTSFDYPIPAIGAWNLAVGFGFALVGLGMLTRWQ
ncbi:cell division protein CrgA [Cellulomonas denverensis]|uniref:Cell division protein CrgA n=1 Tax=Cellulomonas denverensis TaxID=264297 RepID=A0A7X6R0J8_9CELL|nr:cell division protein CrgA [Cellulomonas denverensis]NKY24280.1 cell division protein CrgA [Cellulomonas denverensis]GIG26758.1 cell division protein CrgA [Cellulomonas denverensis]